MRVLRDVQFWQYSVGLEHDVFGDHFSSPAKNKLIKALGIK